MESRNSNVVILGVERYAWSVAEVVERQRLVTLPRSPAIAAAIQYMAARILGEHLIDYLLGPRCVYCVHLTSSLQAILPQI
jgi:hypothetical protein